MHAGHRSTKEGLQDEEVGRVTGKAFQAGKQAQDQTVLQIHR